MVLAAAAKLVLRCAAFPANEKKKSVHPRLLRHRRALSVRSQIAHEELIRKTRSPGSQSPEENR